MHARLWLLLLVFAASHAVPATLPAQEAEPPAAAEDDPPAVDPAEEIDEETPVAPQRVEVDDIAGDDEIAERLLRILNATERVRNPGVEVVDSVVFLTGTAATEEFKTWAGSLARNTQDVVEVVNRIEIAAGPYGVFTPAYRELQRLGRDAVELLPLLVLMLVVIVLTWYAAKFAIRLADRLFRRRFSNSLIRQVAAKAIAIPVILFGIYIALRVAGLTQMAGTVLGGTGIVGLVLGIAFRDIAENFLASILISLQRPFELGDLVQIGDHRGYVQAVTTRGTELMTLDGNNVQIPNSTVYKATIENYTANRAIRLEFSVGIGYGDSVTQAQEVALDVLTTHPVVLGDPEPLVLVSELGAATVNLHVYFWIDGHEHSVLKARSSVVRLVKRAFEKHGISMPDEAREVVFPDGVPVVQLEGQAAEQVKLPAPAEDEAEKQERQAGDDAIVTSAEGDFASEADEISEQAALSRRAGDGENLLEPVHETEPDGVTG